MENLMNFIPEFLFIVIVATYVVGIFLKRLESVKDKYITLYYVFAITEFTKLFKAGLKVALDLLLKVFARYSYAGELV